MTMDFTDDEFEHAMASIAADLSELPEEPLDDSHLENVIQIMGNVSQASVEKILVHGTRRAMEAHQVFTTDQVTAKADQVQRSVQTFVDGFCIGLRLAQKYAEDHQ